MGRFAALTNYRNPANVRQGTPSRGRLVADFLTEDDSAEDYLASLAAVGSEYNGFNLLFGSVDSLGCYSNADGRYRPLAPGLHGLSNHLLNTSWPKVERGKAGLRRVMDREGEQLVDGLFKLLSDPAQAAPEDLPETGVGATREQGLSPIFITLPGYGTRSSTVVLVDAGGTVRLVERTYSEDRAKARSVEFKFRVERND